MSQLALITGATKGIGKAVCEKFIARNYNIVGLAREQVDLPWPVIQSDLSDPAATEAAFKEVIASFGVPQILVNNAGMYFAAPWDKQSIDQFDATIQVNTRAVFQLSKLFANELIEHELPGAIVNVTSVSGRIGSIDPAYAASKAAADALTKSFARSLAEHGIRVNSVSPGPVNTEMAARIPEERRKQYEKSILSQRFGAPEEIAHVVYFLASEEASFVTGEIVYATGGML